MAQDKLRIIPLGGLGEFGMNCTALRWQDEIIVIDAGLMFPEEELLGVDIVVPDISYLTENREKVRAIVLTHGHEDHIGGLPWILSELNVPVYGTEFTLALVEGKLDEHHLLENAELIEILPGRRFTLGPFSIMPIRVTHSLVDCVALAIHTPVGVVVHSGDFKIDLSSPDGNPFDLHSFAELGKQGVLCLLQDSTNVDRPGYTPSERAVRPRLDEIFAQTKKKLFFSCFSSSIHRIRIAMELADAHGRKVAVIGRSLDNSTEIAQDLGYLDLPAGLVINSGQLRDMPDNKVLVMISGTQGEPMSALSRAAVNNHKYAHIEAGDTVVLSSRIIPGNEKSIYRMIDHLERRDAKVIHDDGTQGLIHVSGHGIAGRDAVDDQPDATAVLRPHPRRLSPPEAPRRAGRRDGCSGEGDSAGGRRYPGTGQELRAEERQGHGGPRVHRCRRLDRCGGRHHPARPPAHRRGRHCAAHFDDQQTHRQGGGGPGDCDARIHRGGPGHDRRSAPGGAAYPGSLQRRGEG